MEPPALLPARHAWNRLRSNRRSVSAAIRTPLRNLRPGWVRDGGIPPMLERLRRADVRARIRADIARDGLNNCGRIPSWDVGRVAGSPHLPVWTGDV